MDITVNRWWINDQPNAVAQFYKATPPTSQPGPAKKSPSSLDEVIKNLIAEIIAQIGQTYHAHAEATVELTSLSDITSKPRESTASQNFETLDEIDAILGSRFEETLCKSPSSFMQYSIHADGETCTLKVELEFPDPDNPKLTIRPGQSVSL